MSHYAVGVICKHIDEIEKILAPYDENIEVEPYVTKTKEQIIKDGKENKTRLEERIKKDKKFVLSEWNEQLLNCKTDEDFYDYETDEYEKYDKYGNKLSTYNPKSKWDWYQVGGRYRNRISLKDGEKCDIAKLKDINFGIDKEQYEKEKRFWEIVVENQPLKDGEEKPFNLYKKEYYFERYKDKNDYATKNSKFKTFALLTPDGNWFEQGKMGWFGLDKSTHETMQTYEEKFNEIVNDKEYQDYYFVLVDCHI